MITPETIDRIMDAIRIEEVVGEFVSLKKRGVNLIGLCPFHNEKTPSFTVSAPKGIFKCFGCGKGGNAVNFVMEHEHYTYPEALKYLAGKYGIEIEETKPSPDQQEEQDEKERLFNLSGFAQKFYQEQLHQTGEGKAIGLSYLKERGFTSEVILKFGLGYAANQWDLFSQNALKSGYKKDLLEKASLSRIKDHQIYDTFRGRIIFPIHNLSGRVLGFGARILTSDKNKPKYINSGESEIYHKSKVLYGIYFAKSAMVSQDNCYLTEGYTDVIGLHQAGIENVIASSGTALTTEQIKLIRRYTSNITLLFDNDPAGIKAAFRSIDMILEEAMNVRVVLFPAGEDPDSFSRSRRPAEVREYIEKGAVDFITFKTQLLLHEGKNDPIRKAALIREIASTISLIPDPITRSLYIKKCSDLMQIEEKFLVAEVNKLRRGKFKSQREAPADGTENISGTEDPAVSQQQHGLQMGLDSANDHQEKEIIRLLLHYADNEIIFEVENEDKRKEEVPVKVAEFILDDILADKLHFENATCGAIFEAYVKARIERTYPTGVQFVNHPDELVGKLAVDLLSTPYTLSKNWGIRHRIHVAGEEEILKQMVVQAVYSFKLRKLEKMIENTQQELKDLEQSQDYDQEDLIRLLESAKQLKNTRSAFARELNRIVTR